MVLFLTSPPPLHAGPAAAAARTTRRPMLNHRRVASSVACSVACRFCVMGRGEDGDSIGSGTNKHPCPTAALLSRRAGYVGVGCLAFIPDPNSKSGSWACSLEKGSSLAHLELRVRGRLVGISNKPVYCSKKPPTTKMSTHKHFEAGIKLPPGRLTSTRSRSATRTSRSVSAS